MERTSKAPYAISMAEATLWGLPLSALLVAPLVTLHGLLWGWPAVKAAVNDLGTPLYGFLLALVGGILVHELVHGLAWAALSGHSLGVIKFGVQWGTLTPYAHCRIPLKARIYRIGAMLPGLITGLLPAVVGSVIGSGWWAAFGWLMTLSACGDVIVLWLIRAIPPDRLIVDHPTLAGCALYEPESVARPAADELALG